MRYDNLRAFEKHLEGASPLHFSPLYFIISKNGFESQEAAQMLLRFLLPSHPSREYALTTFDGTQYQEGAVWESLYARSFFADTRVIWIQQADKLKKTTVEGLEQMFAKPARSQYIILSAASWAKNTTFYKAAEKSGVILELAEAKPWEKEKRLAEWVGKQAAAERKMMSYPACQMLVRHAGMDQAMLAQEVEKLLCYTIDKKEITAQDVAAICTYQPLESVWQLGEALFRRDAAAALNSAQSILADGQALLPLLRQIRYQFQTEYQICIMLAQGKSIPDISQEFPNLKGPILERHIQQSRQYGLEPFRKGLLALDAAEMQIKNSSIDERVIVELLIVQLTQPTR